MLREIYNNIFCSGCCCCRHRAPLTLFCSTLFFRENKNKKQQKSQKSVGQSKASEQPRPSSSSPPPLFFVFIKANRASYRVSQKSDSNIRMVNGTCAADQNESKYIANNKLKV